MTTPWLLRALNSAQEWGFLGPGPVQGHIDHAAAFWEAWESWSTAAPTAVLDLGSGGGVPGLVLLAHWGVRTVLLDAMRRRTEFLEHVVGEADAPAGGEVWTGRAEVLARQPGVEETFDLVTARSFAPPAATAECAVRFLRVGGALIVSEPPDAGNRWPAAGLAELGLSLRVSRREPYGVVVLVKDAATSVRYPRRVGVPQKRPLF